MQIMKWGRKLSARTIPRGFIYFKMGRFFCSSSDAECSPVSRIQNPRASAFFSSARHGSLSFICAFSLPSRVGGNNRGEQKLYRLAPAPGVAAVSGSRYAAYFSASLLICEHSWHAASTIERIFLQKTFILTPPDGAQLSSKNCRGRITSGVKSTVHNSWKSTLLACTDDIFTRKKIWRKYEVTQSLIFRRGEKTSDWICNFSANENVGLIAKLMARQLI